MVSARPWVSDSQPAHISPSPAVEYSDESERGRKGSPQISEKSDRQPRLRSDRTLTAPKQSAQRRSRSRCRQKLFAAGRASQVLRRSRSRFLRMTNPARPKGQTSQRHHHCIKRQAFRLHLHRPPRLSERRVRPEASSSKPAVSISTNRRPGRKSAHRACVLLGRTVIARDPTRPLVHLGDSRRHFDELPHRRLLLPEVRGLVRSDCTAVQVLEREQLALVGLGCVASVPLLDEQWRDGRRAARESRQRRETVPRRSVRSCQETDVHLCVWLAERLGGAKARDNALELGELVTQTPRAVQPGRERPASVGLAKYGDDLRNRTPPR